jgi:hypothetical protein
MQLSSKAARMSCVSFFTSRQQAGFAGSKEAAQTKTSYLNYENLFNSYSFPVGERPAVPFLPRVAVAREPHPIARESSPYISVNFTSMFDGEGMKEHKRPKVNLVIVLDVSGSMQTVFSAVSE